MSKSAERRHAQLVGQRIRETLRQRKQRGLPHTYEWLAGEIGVSSTGTVGNYVQGKREPKLEMLGRLAKALDKDPLWLGALEGYADGQEDRRLHRLIELWNYHDQRTRDIIFRVAEVAPDYHHSGEKQIKKRQKSG